MKKFWLLPALSFLLISACSRPQVGLEEYLAGLRTRVADGSASSEERLALHRMRNAEAMAEMNSQLDPEEGPSRITYVAAGSHLAPLVLCERLPVGAECEILMTEINGGVQQEISEELELLLKAGCLNSLDEGQRIEGPAGSRDWQFSLKDHRVRLRLQLSDPGRIPGLIRPEYLKGRDLLISHDWAGDPLGNLRVIRSFLRAARGLENDLPLLMIENLEAHPYPVDLEFFGPVARSALPYGHRDSDRGVGRHGHIELGRPVFGGAVLLSFKPPWWKELSEDRLDLFFDFLLFNNFDLDRQNVLSGGEAPLLSPEILDWWTAFGARDIRGRKLSSSTKLRREMLESLPAIAEKMPEGLRKRLACRAALYMKLMKLRAAGVETLELFPSSRYRNRPKPGHFPDEHMERLYRQSLRHVGQFRSDRVSLKESASKLIEEVLKEGDFTRLLEECPSWSEEGEGIEEMRQSFSELDAELSRKEGGYQQRN